MEFPPGRAIFVLLVLSMLTGIPVALRHTRPRADLLIWTFDPMAIDRSMIGKNVDVQVISTRALDTRLLSQFASGASGSTLPDLVEIEIGSIGKFFRAPVDQIGFRPLNDLLADGLGSRLLPGRLIPWSKGGIVFGLPQDVHPVSLTYNKLLFDQAGVDPASCQAWPDLRAAGERFESYWHAHGQPSRHALLLSQTAADDLIVMLQQRHVDLLDAENGVHLTDARIAETVVFYASLVVGNHAISDSPSPGEGEWSLDIERGDACMLLTADWKAAQLQSRASSLAGQMAMIPLPRFERDDAPTASWGGTMIGLPRNGAHVQQAWALAEQLTLHPPAGVLPAVPERWSDPMFHQSNPFFVGQQKVTELYIQLARELPPRTITAFSAVADAELADVLRQAVQWQRDHPDRSSDDPEALSQCQSHLRSAATDLRERIRIGTF